MTDRLSNDFAEQIETLQARVNALLRSKAQAQEQLSIAEGCIADQGRTIKRLSVENADIREANAGMRRHIDGQDAEIERLRKPPLWRVGADGVNQVVDTGQHDLPPTRAESEAMQEILRQQLIDAERRWPPTQADGQDVKP